MTKQNDTSEPGKKVKNLKDSFTSKKVAKLSLRRQRFQMATSIHSFSELKNRFQV